MLKTEEELLKKLSIADLERANAYAKDLGRGLQIVRSFSQGVTFFGSARLAQNNKYCKMAYKLGGLLAENGHTVITGGGPGIMEAANHGAYELGGRSIGLNITLAHEQFPNPYLTDCITFEYFFARKVSLAMSAKVFVFFPGGFGTMDELSEILCLMQEAKMPKMPVFLIGKDYWKAFDKIIGKMMMLKLINVKDAGIFTITDDVQKVVDAANKIGHPKISENFYDGFREASSLATK
ncbi:MAG: TIGR00730 family Rossman fold protein [Candidatus Saccharibacteria bacterium]|uniref:Cytokinin riboside 5'-monophosphate phosphoribohydrolase n=1 Tax=Candidatus Nanosyncoccus alces TaxID=2171997 RepID=A0ABY0FL85_9BACT|nr:TIGR00730 family Rossman fold protein [Candidatus Nanosyncoccus alces]MBQ2643580.1 TIGR00730 family Rossman fold protein [Candidatus Saccharibacteria bacterium]MDO4398783.1 TIGR00730 family Rossman fold protein [Candidatus Saccharibacteria bacterium]RYC74512.1 LOG family protein YvdD [Candidatus Nanosyncoccus alces]